MCRIEGSASAAPPQTAPFNGRRRSSSGPAGVFTPVTPSPLLCLFLSRSCYRRHIRRVRSSPAVCAALSRYGQHDNDPPDVSTKETSATLKPGLFPMSCLAGSPSEAARVAAAESRAVAARAQAAMLVEAVEDRAQEVRSPTTHNSGVSVPCNVITAEQGVLL